MKQKALLFFVCLFGSLTVFSCIDRDTIAGTGKEEPDKIISAGGGFQSGVINTKLVNPLKVRILAANGRPVRSIIVEFSVENSNASFSDTTAVSDGDGYATTYVTLGSKADSVRIYATVFGLKGSPVKFSLYATSSSATKVELINGNNQTGTVGAGLPIPLKVKVSDSYGNLVQNVPIYFSTLNGKLKPAVVLTDSSGLASSVWTLDTLIGNKSAQAMVPSITNGTINFSATANSLTTPSKFQKVSKDTFYTLQGTTINNILQVKVLDKYGNPIYRFPVEFSVVQGKGTVSPLSSLTNSSGFAVAGVSVADNDSILRISSDVKNNFPLYYFTFFVYKYLQLDSLSSNGGVVRIYWQKSLNPNFANYTVQRCGNFSFDNTTVDFKVITDENVTSTNDATAVVGSSPYYRVRVNYTNGFYFYTNLLNVTVNP